MAFFGKLFEKKECAFCGGEIGLLGNRKLEDGNMCKHCAAKLSPWFEDRRQSTVEQIREQLEYRETNKEKVSAFNTTRTLGEDTKILLDEDAGVFMVTSARDLAEENPDVLSFADVTGCELDIEEDEEEITRTDKEGKKIPYNPPRYRYSYDFYIVIHVRNPYFDEIRFRLNDSSVEIQPPAPPVRPMVPGGGARARAELNRPDVAAAIGRTAFGGAPRGRFDPERDVDYRRYKEMGGEIKALLLQIRQQTRDEKAAAAAPKAAVTCPYCGATTTPDPSGCCEYCGGSVNN